MTMEMSDTGPISLRIRAQLHAIGTPNNSGLNKVEIDFFVTYSLDENGSGLV